jgi:hypothetical protein
MKGGKHNATKSCGCGIAARVHSALGAGINDWNVQQRLGLSDTRRPAKQTTASFPLVGDF